MRPSSGLYLRDAVRLELLDLLVDDDAAATAEDPDVRRTPLPEEVDDVLEELEVTALVGGDRDAVSILLDRRRDDLVDGAIVTEMNHLGTLGLKDAPHDVDGGIVSVEQ